MGFDSGISHIVSHRSKNWTKEDLLLQLVEDGNEPTTIIITLDKRSNKHLSLIFKIHWHQDLFKHTTTIYLKHTSTIIVLEKN